MRFAPQPRDFFWSLSKPTFRPAGATTHWKNNVFHDFSTFLRALIFFLLMLSLLWLFLFPDLISTNFFSSLTVLTTVAASICRKFDFFFDQPTSISIVQCKTNCLSLALFLSLSVSIYTYNLSTYLPIYLSAYLSIYLSIYLIWSCLILADLIWPLFI